MPNTLNKAERLCGKKKIENLFAQGNSFFAFPFIVRWQIVSDEQKYPAQLLIIAPKRKLRHAVDRNRTKRIIRECYRVQKSTLYDFLSQNNLKICLAFSYVETRTPDYHTLLDKTDAILKRICQDIEKEISAEQC